MLAAYRSVSGRVPSLTCRSSHLSSVYLPLCRSPSSSSSSSSIPPSIPLSTSSYCSIRSHHLHPSLDPSPRHCHSFSRSLSRSVRPSGQMDLKEVLEVLEQLAPLSLAESWDNVGLLVEPSKARPIRTILLTNDLTGAVMDEAEVMTCDLIISYHPPLFQPIKRLVQNNWKQRLVVRAVEAGMAVFSPHTSWDSVKGGVNDWLIGGVGSGSVSVLSQALSSAPQRQQLDFYARSKEEVDTILAELAEAGTPLQHSAVSGLHVSVTCPASALTPSVQVLLRHASPSQSLSILQTQKPHLPGHGQGRLSILDQPVTVATAVQKMKSHLGMSHLRLALGAHKNKESTVSTVAVCAGSGGSVLNGVGADLYITGEMSHHEVLDAVAAGTSVILSDHSNSERGFLTVFKERLAVRLADSVTVAISQVDRDPLEVV